MKQYDTLKHNLSQVEIQLKHTDCIYMADNERLLGWRCEVIKSEERPEDVGIDFFLSNEVLNNGGWKPVAN